MTLVRKRPMRLPAAALVALASLGLVAEAGASETTTQTSWQLRAQVRVAPGRDLSGPRTLPDAMDLLHQAACGGARKLLRDGKPAKTRIQLTLWRQAGQTDATHTGPPNMG
ncbi:MAG TPA: hypothetical protein VHH92_06085, partial [Actinomycetota bacterium]|nr:hypothetical protein [Actinomycetota bacterium]